MFIDRVMGVFHIELECHVLDTFGLGHCAWNP